MNYKTTELINKVMESDTTTIVFQNTDHTVGSILQDELLKNDEVLVCAYDVPHPLKKEMHLNLITIEQDDAKLLLNKSIDNILNNIDIFEKEFKKALSKPIVKKIATKPKTLKKVEKK